MPLTTIPGLGFWFPAKGDESYQFVGTTFRMDAAGEKVQIIFPAPKTGTIAGFGLTIITLGNAPDNGLKCSLQTVDPATGLPSGTIMASGAAHVTTTAGTPSATGWFEITLGATVAVTSGDILSAVVEFGGAGFVASDSVSFGGTNRCGDTGLPFGVSATSTRVTSEFPSFALRYDDGTYAMVQEEVWPATLHGDFDIDTGTAANEAGLRFSVPVPLRLRALATFMRFSAAGADYEIALYDASGTAISGPLSIDGDHAQSTTGSRYYVFPLPTEIVLKPNVEYIVGVKPTTTTNLQLVYYTFNSLALLNAVPGGSEWYAVTRPWTAGTPGAWTRYNNGTDGYRRTRIFLWLSAVDYGVHSESALAL